MSEQPDLFSSVEEQKTGQGSGMGPEGLSAYVACPITNADQATSARVDEGSAAIAALLPKLGFSRVHLPKDYSSPTVRPDMGGREVARVDKDLLIESDLIIFLAEDSSTGSGMEIAWSVDGGLHLLVAVSSASDTHPARIATGSSGRASEELYGTVEQLCQQVEKFVKTHREALEAHAEWRRNAPAVLGPLQQSLAPIADGLRRNGDTWPTRHLQKDAELIDLCAESVPHLAGLTFGEYARLELASGRRPFQSVSSAYPSGILEEMASGLGGLAEFHELSVPDVLQLLVKVESELATLTTRVDFDDPDYWRKRLKG